MLIVMIVPCESMGFLTVTFQRIVCACGVGRDVVVVWWGWCSLGLACSLFCVCVGGGVGGSGDTVMKDGVVLSMRLLCGKASWFPHLPFGCCGD